MAEPMLSVYNINVWYGAIHAIKDISFNVNEGEIVALIGANGAGKSTTLKTVSGLLRSKTGSIKFMGEDITHTPADKLVGKGLAQVPEGFGHVFKKGVGRDLLLEQAQVLVEGTS